MNWQALLLILLSFLSCGRKTLVVNRSGTQATMSPQTFEIPSKAASGSGASATQAFPVLPSIGNTPPSSNEQFLLASFEALFQRVPSAEELNSQRLRLESGVTRETVMLDIVLGEEFRGWWRGELVKMLYKQYLDREASTDDVTYWANEIVKGKSELEIIVGIVTSAEFVQRFPGTEALVEHWYLKGLGRASEPGGLAYWKGQLGASPSHQTRVNVALDFFGTGEARAARTIAAVRYWFHRLLGRAPMAGESLYAEIVGQMMASADASNLAIQLAVIPLLACEEFLAVH